MSENWLGDELPGNAANSNVLIDNRSTAGTITTMSISANRTLGSITFDNVNSVLASTLNIDTNGSGTIARSLTLHGGVTLQNSNTTVAFRGSNGVLSVVLGANNVFSASSGSYLQFNSGVVISGEFGVTIAGAGNVGINSPSTFTGGVTVQSGSTLRIGASLQNNSSSSTVSGGVLVSGQAGTGTLAMQSGSTLLSGGAGQRSLQNSLTLNGAVTFGASSTFTGALVFNSSIGTGPGETMTTPNTITLLGNTTVTSHVTTSFFNVMSGAFSLTKQGPGSLRVSATNTYSGGTTVASGTLEFGRTSSLGTGTVMLGSSGGGNASLLNYLGGWTLSNNVIVAADSGGTLTLGYTSGADFSGIFEGTITLNDHLTLRSDAVDGFAMRITGAISGAYNLTKTGTGMVRIEANNTGYSGTTTISAGTLQLGSFAGSASGSIGNGEIINNAALRINRSNAFTLSNLISGSGAVAQTGAGTTTLSNANTYSGGTSVSGGSLFVTNTTGSATGTGALTTASSTILGGTGMISPTGANGISIAGSVAPGVSGSAGTLTFTPADGNVIFQSGSSVVFELFGNGSNDKLVLNASGSGVIDFSALTAGSLGVTFAAGYTPALGHSFDLLDWAEVSGSGISGLSASLLNASTAGFDPSWIWDTSAFASDGMITIVLVPEPTRTFLAALGLMALTLRRQR
jgi:autotransporter-associated beta strand protein